LRRERAKNEILLLLKEEISERMSHYLRDEIHFEEFLDKVASGRKDPHTAVREIIRTMLPGFNSGNKA
jgi:hypothetical protein